MGMNFEAQPYLANGEELIVADEGNARALIGSRAESRDGRMFRYARFGTTVKAGDVLTERIQSWTCKGVLSTTQTDLLTLEFAAGTTISIAENELGSIIVEDSTQARYLSTIFVKYNPAISLSNAAGSFQIQIDNGTRQLSQLTTSTSGIRIVRRRYFGVGKNGLTPTGASAQSADNGFFETRGVAVADANEGQVGYILTCGAGVVKLSGSSGTGANGVGRMLVADTTQANAGEVKVVSAAGDLRYCVGEALETTSSGDFVRATVNIGYAGL